jgi:flagella basal body P-ring formation protein FlgA
MTYNKKIALFAALLIASFVNTTLAATLEREQKAALIKTELKNQLGADDVSLTLDADVLSTEIAAKNPSYALENLTTDDARKRFDATLSIKNDAGVTVKVLEMGGRYSPMLAVPVLTSNLAAQRIITEADITTLTIAEDKINNRVLTEKDKLIGMETKRSLAAQRPLNDTDVTAPKIIKKGELIAMKVSTAYMQLNAQGRALQDGAMGDSIRALNLTSKKTIEGVVTSAGTVEVPTSLGQTGRIVMQALQDTKKTSPSSSVNLSTYR